ncbi:MAG: CBS domain-containing protein [bacterium]
MHVGPEVPKVHEEVGLKEAIVEMTKKTLGLTTVVDSGGKLVGCITDGDLRRIIQRVPNIFECKVKEVMSTNPKTISKDVFLSDALDMMEKFKITNIIITNGNDEPFGIIHIHDIV